ncbi:hypothetical protein SCLARK_001504 [Spiroplasma clarkii]|nr:hypothetical protein [Spiroplasma clarkii]ARU92017.1 hypothetical protein SCLARK_001504 [Spiroplasma clarkii]
MAILFKEIIGTLGICLIGILVILGPIVNKTQILGKNKNQILIENIQVASFNNKLHLAQAGFEIFKDFTPKTDVLTSLNQNFAKFNDFLNQTNQQPTKIDFTSEFFLIKTLVWLLIQKGLDHLMFWD